MINFVSAQTFFTIILKFKNCKPTVIFSASCKRRGWVESG